MVDMIVSSRPACVTTASCVGLAPARLPVTRTMIATKTSVRALTQHVSPAIVEIQRYNAAHAHATRLPNRPLKLVNAII